MSYESNRQCAKKKTFADVYVFRVYVARFLSKTNLCAR